jgi:predicted ATPase
LSSPNTPPIQRLGPYEILGRLGAGGMGEVWLARDGRLQREVALKLLPHRMMADTEALALFRNEALALASLNHPNIATIHGLEEMPDGTMVLVLERVEGETLAHRIASAPLAIEEALQISAQVAQALEVAHERGIVHRDLKPGNVMIGPRGLVKVLDFGLAKRTYGLANPRPYKPGDSQPGFTHVPSDQPASMSGPVSGTPGYMSPEQVLAGTQDERTDVFAFGCVLYECLSGRRAFPADDPFVAMAQVLNDEPDLAALPPSTPPVIRKMLGACLAKDTEQRPRSARDLRHAIEEALGIRRAAALREGEAVTTPHNLPAQATSFVGRQQTLEECARALAETRLLTLTGIGGSGKTRLALQLAEGELEKFHDGVWFVDVAPLTESERLVESLAAVLGVPDEQGRPLIAGVTAWLKPRHALLVLDNAETHSAACGALATELLRACPSVKLVVTHRAALELEGETLYTVPTLDIPDESVRTAAAADASESVRLFCERARAASTAFQLTDDNAEAVAEICRRLDGIPLALELAAARVRVMAVDQIRARLGDRFKLLTRSGTGASSRQQTVLAVIQWSWDHLLEPEQDLLRRLAVFTGGWTLERATSVCSDDGDEFGVLDLLTRLVERSLVVVRHVDGGHVRYRFLESVWRFALDKFEAHAEHAVLRERHLAEYLALVERLAPALEGADLANAMKELVPDEENILAAMAWCEHAEQGVERGFRLLLATNRFWGVRGRYALGMRLAGDALKRDTSHEPTPLRAAMLTRFAGFALPLGDYEAGRPVLEESLAISRSNGDRKGEARALAGLGVVAFFQSRFEDALMINSESLQLYESLGQRRGVAMTLHNLAYSELTLGIGDHGRAKFESALAMLRESGDRSTEALCLGSLASTLTRLGLLEEARGRLVECFAALADLEAPREGVEGLDALVEWLVTCGRLAEAARMLGAAVAARASLGLPRMPIEEEATVKREQRLIAELGAAETARARAEGAALSLVQALAEAAALANGVHLA